MISLAAVDHIKPLIKGSYIPIPFTKQPLSNHPFIDGNKRTAYVVCRTFVKLNGHDLLATPGGKIRRLPSPGGGPPLGIGTGGLDSRANLDKN